MTRDELARTVLELLASVLDDDASVEDLHPEFPIRDQVDLDSMTFLDLVMALRERLGVNVPERDYAHLVTLESSVEYLLPRLPRLPAEPGGEARLAP